MNFNPNFLFQENLRMKQFVQVVSLLIIGATVSMAQPTLTLDKAVQLAVERNSTVVQARNTYSTQETAVQAAYGNLFPSVGVSGSGDWTKTKTPGYVVGGVAQGGQDDFSSYYRAGIGASVTLFDGFANYSTIDQVKARKEASSENLTSAQQNAIYQTHLLFLSMFRTFELLKVNEDNLKRSQRQLTRITEANKVGSVALADVYRQRVQVGSDELALIQSQNNLDKAKADLYSYLGIDNPDNYPIGFEGISTDIDTVEFEMMNSKYSNFESLLNQAKEHRPDYRSAKQSLSASESGIIIAKSSNLPSLSGSASYGYGSDELSSITDNSTLSFGLNLQYSIFNGFLTKLQVEQAQVNKMNAEEQLNQTIRQIRFDLQKAILDLGAAQKQIKVTTTSVESAEMDRKIAEEKYNLGAGTLLDVLIAQANYTTAINNNVNAVIGYLLSKKQLEFTLGTISQ
ncbi:MAG: TolC family protein [Bacteroidetes bacterium]|nr:MAG: TolC family protein [Bacteroidota bacterium]